VTAARLHALQGRQNVTCPRCKHSLHVHGDEGCRECTGLLEEVVYSYASCFMREAVAQHPCASDEMKARAAARRTAP